MNQAFSKASPAGRQSPAVPRKQPGEPSAARPEEAGPGEFVVGDPVRFQNLTVFPVASKVPKSEDRYLTLDEGLKAGLVQEGKGQQAVWAKVGEANASSGARSRSDAFTANYTNPRVLKQLQAYVNALQEPVANHEQVVGAIVAIKGEAEAVDVFQSTPLFQKLWPKCDLMTQRCSASWRIDWPG